MKFQVFQNGKPVKTFSPAAAYMFGTDGIAIRKADICFENGLLDCRKPNMETAGLAVMWPVEGFGKVLLSTTCLPEKTRPYILNLEITRAKLMQILNKREDWAFFKVPEELNDLLKKTQAFFVKAIQNISDPAAASKLADEALKRALAFSEKLAARQADMLFQARCRNKGFNRVSMGCIIDPARVNDNGYIKIIADLFGFATVPFDWNKIEVQKGEYDFTELDRIINALTDQKVTICGGPLLCFSEEKLPNWLKKSKNTFDEIRDLAYHFVQRVVNRYSNTIRVWRVVSGLNLKNYFGFNFDQVIEVTRAANMAVKAESERSLKIIEVCNIWGEYYSSLPNTLPPLVYIDMIIQAGINFDAFGIQLLLGKDKTGMHIRDMLQISAVLEQFIPVAKPVYITEVEVPGKSSTDEDNAGIWHGQWNEDQQAQWIEEFYKIALSKPFVESVTYAHLLDDQQSLMPESGLLTTEYKSKKAFECVKKLRKTVSNK